MGCLPLYLGSFTLLESMSCIGVTTISLLVMAILEEDELKFTYVFFALFTLFANALFKVVLVAKEYVLHMSSPEKDNVFRRYNASNTRNSSNHGESRSRRGNEYGASPSQSLWDQTPFSTLAFSLTEDAELKLRITDFLSQTSNDLLSSLHNYNY